MLEIVDILVLELGEPSNEEPPSEDLGVEDDLFENNGEETLDEFKPLIFPSLCFKIMFWRPMRIVKM